MTETSTLTPDIANELLARMTHIRHTIHQAQTAADWFSEATIEIVDPDNGTTIGDDDQQHAISHYDLLVTIDGFVIRRQLGSGDVFYNGQDAALNLLYEAFGDGREEFLYQLDDCIAVMTGALADLVRMCGPDSLNELR